MRFEPAVFVISWLFVTGVGGFSSPLSSSISRCRPISKVSASSSSSSSSVSPTQQQQQEQAEQQSTLDEEQLDFTMGYINKHHADLMTRFAEAYSELGQIQSKRNSFSGGSYKIQEAILVDVTPTQLDLQVTVKDRNEKEPIVERVSIDLDASPFNTRDYRVMPPVPHHASTTTSINPVDDMVRRLNRLAWMVKMPEVTGKFIQLAIQIGGDGVGKLKDDMYLNQVPHNRYVRNYFYQMAADAALEAVILCSDHKISNRMKMTCMFPEMNPSMDSYRIGTLLELTRTIAIRLAEQNLRVRICVQGSMGVGIFVGVPKQLNGVATLLQRMDWQSEEGEENEGMVGNYVNFGSIGKEHVVNAHVDKDGNKVQQDDVFILICPQSMVGVDSSIMGPLQDMVEAAGDRPVILINPDLTDKISSQGQQSVRGRKERMEFADSFQPIFHFQNIYVSGTSYFPILGAICKLKPSQPWVAHQRRDLVNNEGEVYVPVLSCEEKPDGEVILNTFER